MNWIGVKDSLPEIPTGALDKLVLVYTIAGHWIKAAYRGDENWYSFNSKDYLPEGVVTHWCEVTGPE